MTDQQKTAQDQETEDLELTDEQAQAVQGGVTPRDIPVTKPIDKPSP